MVFSHVGDVKLFPNSLGMLVIFQQYVAVRDCSFEIREGGRTILGRVIKFLTSFLGFLKIYDTRFGGLQIFLHKIVRI